MVVQTLSSQQLTSKMDELLALAEHAASAAEPAEKAYLASLKRQEEATHQELAAKNALEEAERDWRRYQNHVLVRRVMGFFQCILVCVRVYLLMYFLLCVCARCEFMSAKL